MVHISGMKNFGGIWKKVGHSNTVTLNDIASLPERGLLGFD